jgi:glycosyltransferase involved in cell wall biosynthesis
VERTPEAWALALNELLGDDERRAEFGRRAYQKSREMVWSRVAEQYRSLFSRIAAGTARPLHATTLTAVSA